MCITALYITVTRYITVAGQLRKVDLDIAVTLYIAVMLPFPKCDRCTGLTVLD